MSPSVPAPPSSETIRRALGEFQLSASDLQVSQIQQYIKILLVWNDKVNLTAIRDPLEILYRHFCESMYAATVISLQNGRLADIGSGGGFPGIPLKIMRPELEVFLVESQCKKGHVPRRSGSGSATYKHPRTGEPVRGTRRGSGSPGHSVLARGRRTRSTIGLGPIQACWRQGNHSVDRRARFRGDSANRWLEMARTNCDSAFFKAVLASWRGNRRIVRANCFT